MLKERTWQKFAYLHQCGRRSWCNLDRSFEVSNLTSRLLRFWYGFPALTDRQKERLSAIVSGWRFREAGRKAHAELGSNAELSRFNRLRSELCDLAKDPQFDRSSLDHSDRQLLEIAASMPMKAFLDPLTEEERDRDRRRANIWANRIIKLFRETYPDERQCPAWVDRPQPPRQKRSRKRTRKFLTGRGGGR